VRVLFVGLGSIGRRHLCNLNQLGISEIVAWRARGGGGPVEGLAGVVDDLQAGLRWGPDVVMVCNPPSLHVPVALEAARAGCNLFIEKPLSSSWHGVPELVREARDRQLVTLVGFNLRFHPGLRLLKSIVEAGRLGRVVSVRANVGQHLPDWHPAEDYRLGYSAQRSLGGGVILDLIHELDYIRWIAGPVHRVACFGGHRSGLDIETEDVAEILLDFVSGAVGSVHLDYVERTLARECRVIGENGTAVWDQVANHVRVFDVSDGQWKTMQQPPHSRNDTFVDEMRHLVDCVAGASTPIVDSEAGAETLRVALAAREALERGTVIDLATWVPA
jgi:predicted dehydrogenase